MFWGSLCYHISLVPTKFNGREAYQARKAGSRGPLGAPPSMPPLRLRMAKLVWTWDCS